MAQLSRNKVLLRLRRRRARARRQDMNCDVARARARAWVSKYLASSDWARVVPTGFSDEALEYLAAVNVANKR